MLASCVPGVSTMLAPGVRCLHATAAAAGKIVPRNLKGRSKTSQDWLTRQLNDPYVKKAKKLNYRARSAFKLLELQEKLQVLRPGQGVVECGCAPGAWTQVLVQLCNAAEDYTRCEEDGGRPSTVEGGSAGRVVGVDLQAVVPVPGAVLLQGRDFTSLDTQADLIKALHPYKLDVLLSDMAPNATGVRDLDHERILRLAGAVARFGQQHLTEGGHMLCKIWQGPLLDRLLLPLKTLFQDVRLVKPPSSREFSAECFVFAKSFRGRD